VKVLINALANVNVKTKEGGRTALMGAVYGGHVEMVKLLIDVMTDLEVEDDGGGTAILAAAENGFTEIVSLLINAGADVNHQNLVRFLFLHKTNIYAHFTHTH
jgi:ankyrin repeat protein